MATSERTPFLYFSNNSDNNIMVTHSCLSEFDGKGIKRISFDCMGRRQFNDDRAILKMDLPAVRLICGNRVK